MLRLIHLLLPVWMLVGTEVSAKDPFEGVPAAIASYAAQFEQDCASSGLGHVVPSDNYGEFEGEPFDLNGDQVPDYIVYKCMFGCSAKPEAFTGRGTPCAWGSLLLSDAGGHAALFLPGLAARVFAGPPIRVAITRPRAFRIGGNYCKDPDPGFDPQYAYELKAGRFQLIGRCPSGGCETLLAQSDRASTP
jgi:hypothetical protein